MDVAPGCEFVSRGCWQSRQSRLIVERQVLPPKAHPALDAYRRELEALERDAMYSHRLVCRLYHTSLDRSTAVGFSSRFKDTACFTARTFLGM